ncbi:MAG: 5-formyltetrahydrofolate cyclo-ligase [Candidatus Thermoplasmatota archaeon]
MKDSIRQKIIKQRKAMPPAEVATKSMLITSRILQLDEYHAAQTILFYISYNNEVNTHHLIRSCLASEKTVVVPKTDTKKKKILLSRLNSWDDLEEGSYHILEPKQKKIDEIPLKDIDLIFVPGIAFDPSGNRIGHGHGYYDRLLMMAKDKLKIALAFELQIVDHIPEEKHDVRMNTIITEQRIIHCSNAT